VYTQELYTGGKDCNILAWVPALRAPDVEEESGVNKVHPPSATAPQIDLKPLPTWKGGREGVSEGRRERERERFAILLF